MLAELIPFFRSIASTIQSNLGAGHPGVLPTTMAAFAMSSVLLGIVFVLLAALRCGSLVGYFPETVMKGMVGMNTIRDSCIGLTLCRCCWGLSLHPRA
jgi:MFS superfamily sulfate permease-like transporter